MRDYGWEYCECGCHTSDIELGGAKYSHLMRWPGDRVNANIDLHEGSHLMGKKLGNFKNWAELDAFMSSLIKQNIKDLQKHLRAINKKR